MLELTYSNRTEALLDRLAERVRQERASGRGPWEPVHLVVPSPYLKEYLNLGLARKLGVAANLRFTYLDGLWQDLLADGSGLLAFDLLRAGLLCVLADPAFLARPGQGPVRDYLGPDNLPLKRVQLAGELARLFEEYQLSRPDWIVEWRAGRFGARAKAPESRRPADQVMEAWQAELWVEVLRALDGGGREHLTLLERVRRSRLEGMGLPRAIHGFGLTHVAQAYQEVFREFAPLADTTLHLYALNPCAEFWEDLDTGRDAALEDDDPFGLASRGPMALRLWGRPGREKIRLLNEVSECDFTPAFAEPDPATVLGRMQRDILLYRDPAEAPAEVDDGSVRRLVAASPRREAELVATEIWRLLDLRKDLGFSDIAVVVPPADLDAYAAHLQAAFHEARQIPLVQGPRAFPVMGRTLEAVELLLELPTSGMTRPALLRVLQHPALQRRLGDLDTGGWSRWCQDYGIVRGADRSDWDGTYLEPDALNWDQGLKRLVLGEFMAEGETFGDYPVEGARDPASAAAFIAHVRGLCADARELVARPDAPANWMRRIWRYLERWLETEEGEDAEAVLRCLERVKAYLERVFARVPGHLAMAAIDFPAARHLALEALERLRGEQNANLTKGVVVASYATMRAIPFRVVFLMGNREGQFPTRDRVGSLDLRKQRRRPGDVSRTENEKYLFLEMLLSARDHLVLTYVGMDELSGETFEPSGLYQEFSELLAGYLADPAPEVHPLRRFDPAYFPGWFGGTGGLVSYSEIAAKEAWALCLGSQARDHGIPLPACLGDLELPGADRIRRALEALEVPGTAADPGQVIRIPLGDLRAFLECPLSGAAAVRLGLRRRDLEDRDAMEDEVFESGSLAGWAIRSETALAALAQPGADVAGLYRDCLRRHQSRGEAPFGVFAEVETRDNLDCVSAWVDYLRGEPPPEIWRLGANRSRTGRVDRALPPLSFQVELHGQSRRVELSGELRPQLGGSLFLERHEPPIPSRLSRTRQKALAAYLDHLVLACVAERHGEHLARFVHEKEKGKPPAREIRIRFPALAREDALAQLRAWVEDLLTGDHAVLLPIEAVLDSRGDGPISADGIQGFLDAELEGGQRSFIGTLTGPVPDPMRFGPPPDPQAIVARRLGPFLDLVFDPQSLERV
jgi:exodeoxyribonuclease V gamma subunit